MQVSLINTHLSPKAMAGIDSSIYQETIYVFVGDLIGNGRKTVPLWRGSRWICCFYKDIKIQLFSTVGVEQLRDVVAGSIAELVAENTTSGEVGEKHQPPVWPDQRQ